MIKSYINFITETFSKEEHNSIGEYIQNLAENDDYITMIANQYLGDVDPSIKLSNSINLLDDLEKVELLKRVENYLNGVELEPSVSTSTDINLLEESYGKNLLNTFLKTLSNLGFKDTHPESTEVPSEFLIFFKFNGKPSSDVQLAFNRFKSLKSIKVDYTQPHIGLYYGIKLNGNFEYGYYYDDLIPIGEFKLNKSAYNSLKLSDSKSISTLKKILANLSHNDILLMCKIKSEMDNFQPGYFESKSTPIINDRIITFGYYGVGKWDNGILDKGEFMNIKTNLKTFLSKYKWSDLIQVSINANKFWVYINIKIK
jgi:hypothetical protein